MQGDQKFERVMSYNKRLRHFKSTHDRNLALCEMSLREASREDDSPIRSPKGLQSPKGIQSPKRLQSPRVLTSPSKLVQAKVPGGAISTQTTFGIAKDRPQGQRPIPEVAKVKIETTFPVESDTPIQEIGGSVKSMIFKLEESSAPARPVPNNLPKPIKLTQKNELREKAVEVNMTAAKSSGIGPIEEKFIDHSGAEQRKRSNKTTVDLVKPFARNEIILKDHDEDISNSKNVFAQEVSSKDIIGIYFVSFKSFVLLVI